MDEDLTENDFANYVKQEMIEHSPHPGQNGKSFLFELVSELYGRGHVWPSLNKE